MQRVSPQARLLLGALAPCAEARLQSVVLGRRALGRGAREHPLFGGDGSPGVDGTAPGSQRAQPRGVPRDAARVSGGRRNVLWEPKVDYCAAVISTGEAK